MPTFYLHIGMHKTGTTALQRHFRAHADRFARFGLHYFKTPDPNHSFFMLGEFGSDESALEERSRRQKKLGKYLANRTRYAKAFKTFLMDTASRNGTAVLSGEEATSLPREGIARIQQLIGEYFDRITVVAFVRPPLSYARSSVLQQMKGSGGIALEDFAERTPLPRYQQRFGRFEDIFGSDNIRYQLYHASALSEECVFQTFLKHLHGDWQMLSDERAPRSNESMSLTAAKAISLLRMVDRGTLAPEALPDQLRALIETIGGADRQGQLWLTLTRHHKHIKRALIGLPGAQFVLPREIAIDVKSRTREDAAWMSFRLGTNILVYDEATSASAPSLSDFRSFSDDEHAALTEMLERTKVAAAS